MDRSVIKCPACGADNIEGVDVCDACRASLTDIPGLQPQGAVQRKILQGTLKDLGPRRAVELAPSAPVAAAVEAMRKSKVGCVLAVAGGEIAGVLTERDLLLGTDESTDPAKIPVSRVMRPSPPCLEETDEVGIVFNIMAVSGHLHVPMRFSDGSLGVVSARDLLRYLCKD